MERVFLTSHVMPRSLRVRSDYLHMVKSSLLRNGFPSQKILAEDLGIAQSTVSNFLNGKPVDYANFVEICLVLGQEWRHIADLNEQPQRETISAVPVKIWLSDRSPNNNLARQLQPALSAAGHQVFIAGTNALLENNLETFQAISLKDCDYLLLLLSEQSALSEMVLVEVQLALELHNITPQKPAILPVFTDLSSQHEFSFDLIQLLAGIQPWQWSQSNNLSTLVSELVKVFAQKLTSLPSQHVFAISWTPPPLADKNHASMSPFLPLPVAAPELPGWQVDINSHYYIERPPIESRCYETINQPGSLIRIKAPRQMGKTSLMARILHHAETLGAKTVALSLQLANQRIFANSDTFLQWFCASLGQEFGLLEPLTECWQLAEIIGANQCCKAYFERYLLPKIETSFTLGLDEVDRVFESPEIADDFFGLLRALHEESKRQEIWKKFRLVVVHSTEVYIPLDINKSPFNVGLPIELPEFNSEQIQALARRQGLDWQVNQVELLMELVGGHPYLVRLALYHLARQDVTLNQLIEEAATEVGIYSDHLRRHLWNLEKYPDLMSAIKKVISALHGVRLRSEQAFKLNSIGLIKLEGNICRPRCNLYAQYFREVLIPQSYA